LFLLDKNEDMAEELSFLGREEPKPVVMHQKSQNLAINNLFVRAYKSIFEVMQEQ
jgi:hypothetical protein